MPHAKPRLYRDPVHDTIALAPDSVEGRLLMDLLDTSEMQRLRRIRQLGLSQFVYHGAEHSRFAHSVGCAWLATRMLDQVQRGAGAISEDCRLVTIAAALLHDVGHGPFSHALEGLSGVHHEARSVAIVLGPDTEVHRALARVDASLPGRVASWLGGPRDGAEGEADSAAPAYLRDIVSSQLDADRLDYILRDGVMTGVHIGHYDLARIVAMIDVVDDHLALHHGAQQAVEGYLLARFHMYKQVYLHKTSRAAERMLVAALQRAAALARAGTPPDWWPMPFGRVLLGEANDPATFCQIDDVDVWVALKRWIGEADRPLADLARGLVHRRLFKTLHLPTIDTARAEELISAARAIARVRGFDPDVHVLVDESRDSPYRPFTGLGATSRAIRLIDGAGRGHFIEDRSEVVQMLGRLQHHQRLLCFHPDLADALARLDERGAQSS